nr:hypothetical protein [Tanacetum cinerariifolium]
MANVPSNDPNVDASAIVPAHVNPDHAPEEDAEEEEEDPEEDQKEDPEEEPEDDNDDIEMDDEAKVIDPYINDGSNNPPPLNSKDKETPPTSPVIPNADETPPTSPVIPNVDGQPIPPIASFCKNFHFGSFPLPLGLQVREPPAEPSARPVPAPYPDDPYVVTRDATIADAAIATSGIDDDDDTAPMDSQPHEPCGSPCDPQ